MEITKKTIVADILKEYGDIADVMEALGIKSVGKFSVRKAMTRFITVEKAASIHKVSVDTLLGNLKVAVRTK